jgi:hypothetical protein
MLSAIQRAIQAIHDAQAQTDALVAAGRRITGWSCEPSGQGEAQVDRSHG